MLSQIHSGRKKRNSPAVEKNTTPTSFPLASMQNIGGSALYGKSAETERAKKPIGLGVPIDVAATCAKRYFTIMYFKGTLVGECSGATLKRPTC